MAKKYDFHFISVEGNWDKNIHDERIECAANLLEADQSAFVIASGTYAPEPYSSFYNAPLGRYTAETLISKYKISPERIIPAYLFSFQFTYTIIDAYANSAFIGWLSCGLKRRENEINVLFEPCTSQFHGLRVEMLNARACNFMHDLHVNVELQCKNKLTREEMEKDHSGEIERLTAMKENGGLLSSGEWLDNGVKKSFGNIIEMSQLISKSFSKELCFPARGINIDEWSDIERLLLLMTFNFKSYSKQIDAAALSKIIESAQNRYNIQIPDSASKKLLSLLTE
ncbi:hypothetical protein [Vibrio sp. MEBiC08052]|uniref:hypothetical protein n=1 Tax=Vibrio sp. MEBiC08052 TaxID=1761910 RepID=UPI00074086DE|nr:hypothetical protein [Vibrio sp. MEBiC08052]KUI97141.1 hypothetical protein VRK_37520 [Vibrio sp. MEBiC08052]